MKRNARISGNSGSGAPQNAQNAIKGSTMIAVLAAMLFIGIVTASMVKNTGSQSAASVGYGTMQTMSSTVKSGMVATETYFARNGGWTSIKEQIDNKLKADEGKGNAADTMPFILGKAKNNKQPLSANQYFTSQIRKLDISAAGNLRGLSFEINAGRNQGGKNLKKALAFYNIENKEDITITGDPPFGGMNAFSATDNAEFLTGNSGGVFKGHVTIEKGLKIQNNGVKFLPDKDGNGSVYVKGKTEILKDAVFKVDAYFEDDVTISNLSSYDNIFQKNTGFNKDLDAGASNTVKFGGDVWYNGDYKNQDSNQIFSKLQSNNTNSKFYYTSKIPMVTAAMDNGKCKLCSGECTPPNQGNCCAHGCKHIQNFQSEHIIGFVNMHPDSTSGYKGSDIPNIPQLMEEANAKTSTAVKGMSPLEERKKEPDIAVTNIDSSKTFLSISDPRVKIVNSQGQLDGAVLQKFYEDTKDDPAFKNYYDKEHLLLKIPENTTLTASGGGIFNGKVIFDVEGDVNASGNFYSSDKDASTLVYVGKTGKLDQFGVGPNGTFQGLVYIDKDNKYNGTNGQHTFSWGENSKIEGAVIIKGGNLIWNTSGDIDLNRNDDVLKKFSFLKTDQTEQTNKTVEHKKPADGVKLRAFGYYFY